jgi:Stage II sporulation protein E (SpoIIE)
VGDIVEVVPGSVKIAIAALAALSAMLGTGYFLSTLRARALGRQRGELLSDVGLLQTALLPSVPETLGALRTTVAYRPADGPAAGGDFYDALPLTDRRTAFILGDISGHGRGALALTAFVRYTLRAYLEAGLGPRPALQVAGRALEDKLGSHFATVILAVHDPVTGSLTFASAGHPAPIATGPSRFQPVDVASSPPVGVGLRTGLRETTVPLPAGSLACLYTDGVTEARTERGILGRGRLGDLVEELGAHATATEVLDRVAEEARVVSDDMACCLLAPTSDATSGDFRREQLEVSPEDLASGLAARFLRACGVVAAEVGSAEREARAAARHFGGAVLHVSFGTRSPRVEVLPRNVESIEAASRRVVGL